MLPLAGISGIEWDLADQCGGKPGSFEWGAKIGLRQAVSIAGVNLDSAGTGAFGVAGDYRRAPLRAPQEASQARETGFFRDWGQVADGAGAH